MRGERGGKPGRERDFTGKRAELLLQMEPMMTALGVAVSGDGTSWEKSPHNPIFGPDDSSRAWESHYTTSQTVIRTPDGRWRIWYGARPQPPFVHKYFTIGTASWDGPGD